MSDSDRCYRLGADVVETRKILIVGCENQEALVSESEPRASCDFHHVIYIRFVKVQSLHE